MRKIPLVIIFSLTYLMIGIIYAEGNEEKKTQTKIGMMDRPSSRLLIGGRIGVGLGLPYGSPFRGLGIQLDFNKNFSLLVGGTKLVGFMGAMGVRSYLGTTERRLRPHLSAHVWPYGYGAYVGADYDVGQKRGFVTTFGLGGFGNTKLIDGLMEGFSLLLGLGYAF